MNRKADILSQYKMKGGKLVPIKGPKRNAFLRFSFYLLLTSSCIFGGYALGTQQNYKVPDTLLISEERLKHYKEVEATLERTLAITIEQSRKDYVLSFDELKTVFKHVFPKVKLSEKELNQYLVSSSKWGTHHSIPPLLVLSIIWRESFFDESIVSTANARGPMQVIYKYHKEKLDRIKKKEKDLHDIDTGIRIGVEVLREYFDKYDRNIFRAMTAYVGGTHKTYAQDILTRYFNARFYVEENIINKATDTNTAASGTDNAQK